MGKSYKDFAFKRKPPVKRVGVAGGNYKNSPSRKTSPVARRVSGKSYRKG